MSEVHGLNQRIWKRSRFRHVNSKHLPYDTDDTMNGGIARGQKRRGNVRRQSDHVPLELHYLEHRVHSGYSFFQKNMERFLSIELRRVKSCALKKARIDINSASETDASTSITNEFIIDCLVFPLAGSGLGEWNPQIIQIYNHESFDLLQNNAMLIPSQ